MFILLLVKPKRHGSSRKASQEPPPVPVDDGGIARPLDEQDPSAFPSDPLEFEQDGAPFPRIFVRRLDGT